jgi:hypothetical protein
LENLVRYRKSPQNKEKIQNKKVII